MNYVIVVLLLGLSVCFLMYVIGGGKRETSEEPHVLVVYQSETLFPQNVSLHEFLCESEQEAWNLYFSLKNVRSYKIFYLPQSGEEELRYQG